MLGLVEQLIIILGTLLIRQALESMEAEQTLVVMFGLMVVALVITMIALILILMVFVMIIMMFLMM